ncbi:MAG TPA: SBBP repeat-containing protein [Candidatus Cloacimonadota bacterium]|nr:SBBP repeat-containing protein [Candidatus Cloacimonadota bacterium]
MKRLTVPLLCAFILLYVSVLSAQLPEWVRSVQAGGDGYDYGRSIALDQEGNQYISGYFQDTVHFGLTVLTSRGDHDLFAAKLDPNGNFLWARNFGGSGDDYGRGIAVDQLGNVYVTGYFEGTGWFGSISLVSSGWYDLCVIKLTTDGEVIWANRAGGPGSEWGYCVAVDEASNVYLTGHFTENASFGSTILNSNGSYDMFAAKLDPNGNFLWATQAGGTGIDQSFGLALDDFGNICLAGHFQATASFGDFTLTSRGDADLFAAKLDNNGNFLWAIQAGGSDQDYGFGIAERAGYIYLTGRFSGTALFGTTTLTSNGECDIFAAKLDPEGNFVWTSRAGGVSDDRCNAIAVDAAANVYLTGYFSSACSFGGTTLLSHGAWDVFAAKLDPFGNFCWAVQAGGYGNDHGYALAPDDAGNLYLTGYFRDTATFGQTTFYSHGSEDVYISRLRTTDPPLPLILSSFTATPIPKNSVLLTWVTLSETNMQGFNIWRGTENDPNTATMYNQKIIPATNTSSTQTYTFTDLNVPPWNTYYYWLEAVSNDSNYFFGPASVLLQPTDVDDELNPPLPENSRIVNAWPNPFRQGSPVNIGIEVKQGERGTVSLFNLRGRKLKDYSLEPGSHILTWDGRDLSGKICDSGVYFFRLTTPSRSETRKIVVIR